MRCATAAAYLDMSAATFLRAVAPDLPRVPMAPRTVVYLREDIDAWLDRRAGRAAASPEVNPWHE